jgi:hypothetical protein
MKAVIFIQQLKQTLLTIEKNGSEHIFFVETDYNLIRDIKAYTYNKLKDIQNDKVERKKVVREPGRKPTEFIYDLLSSTLSISGCIGERVGQAFKERLGNYHDIVLGT